MLRAQILREQKPRQANPGLVAFAFGKTGHGGAQIAFRRDDILAVGFAPLREIDEGRTLACR